MFDVSKRIALGAALAVPGLAVGMATDAAHADVQPTAAPTPAKNKCITHVLTKDEIDRGLRSQIACFATQEEALASTGVTAPAAGFAGNREFTTSAGDSILAVHHDWVSGTSATLTVVGANCDGGGLSLAGDSFDNLTSSTEHRMCGKVKHFDGYSMSGTPNEVTQGSYGSRVALGAGMDDRTSSIRYYAS